MRKSSIVVSVAALFLLIPTPLTAQVLVPVGFREMQGANGSAWTTAHYAHNRSSEDIWISAVRECHLSAVHACDAFLPAGESRAIPADYVDRTFGAWFVVDGPADALTISSYVRMAGSEGDWGTAIPSPSFSEFFEGEFQIAPVPADPSSRASLRLYGLPSDVSPPSVDVEIWIYGHIYPYPKHLVRTWSVPLIEYDNLQGQLFDIQYAEMHDIFAGLEEASSSTRAFLKIKSADPHGRVWGFVSVTDNKTQHITVFEPYGRS